MEQTALAVQGSTALQQFGTAEDLKLLGNRIGILFGIADGEMDVAMPALLKAAQLTLKYGYTPGQDIFVIKRGKSYSAEPSLEAWRKTADRHAFIGKFRWWVEVEALTPAEVKDHTDPDVEYDKEDKGARARMWRTDLAQSFGPAYKPKWHYGFWRKKANEKDEWVGNQRTGKKFWQADTVPNGRTRQDVADRRAERAAIMSSGLSMIPLDDFESRYQSQERVMQQRLLLASNHVNMELQREAEVGHGEEEGTLTHDAPGFEMDGDGNVWAVEQPRKRKAVQSSAPEVEEGQYVDLSPEGSTVGEEGSVSGSGESHGGGDVPPSQEEKVRAPSPAPSPTKAPVPDGTPVWQTWKSPTDAQQWAHEVAGTVKTKGEALGSWKKVFKQVWPDKEWAAPEDLPAVFEAFHEHQWQKIREAAKLENVAELAK